MKSYVGRFAPTPSGPLHHGSLVAALASYLQARSQRGQWLLRIEDLDPPRNPTTATQSIIECLSAHGLAHDGEISYQSQRHSLYEHALDQLRQTGRLYACHCTRAQLKAQDNPHRYAGNCRDKKLPENGAALRLRLAEQSQHDFVDLALGHHREDLHQTIGDFVLRRRDGLYAYQLAVVVDDAAQAVSEVVRGADLLDNSARQIHLQQALNYPTPRYLHIPLQLDQHGLKLSKQNHAPALDNRRALNNLSTAWLALGQQPLTTQADNCEQLLKIMLERWQPAQIRPS